MYSTTGPKIPLRSVIKANTDGASKIPERLTAVIVGGTSGIGEAACYKFATYVRSPTIYLLGRNENAAKQVISNLKEINNNQGTKYEFVKCDISLLNQGDEAVKQIMSRESKINSLIVSAGIMGTGKRIETKEGLDLKMSTHYYGRWKIITGLLPLLSKAAELNEPTTVMTILGPDSTNILYPQDLELHNHYSAGNLRSHTTTMNTYAVEHFAKLYPEIAFIHASPGAVKTNIGHTLPWYFRYPANGILNIIGDEPAVFGERIVYLSLINNNFMAKGSGWLLDNQLRKIKTSPPLSEEVEKNLWEHTTDVFKRVTKV